MDPQGTTTSNDPRLVYQRPEVAEAFVNVRDCIPLAKEQMDIMIRIIRHFQPTPKQWLDLGCGDGPLAAQLLEEFPNSHGTLIDHSQPMLDLAKTRFSGQNKTNNLDFHLGDFNNDNFMDAAKQKKFDVIVSGFSIHHVSDSRKRAIYQQIFNLLNPGGVFLNMEHVATPTSDMEAIFENSFCDSMYEAHRAAGTTKSRDEVEAAVRHDLSVDEEANILAPAEEQCNWLREIGFNHVDCYFKFLILALFGGVKPVEG